MIRVRILSLSLAVCCLLGLSIPANAADVECDAVYCFTEAVFSDTEEPIAGICITGLPDASAGTVMLGSRVVRPGDIFTAAQLNQLTFHPLLTREDAQATISYLPIYEDRVEQTAIMTIGIHGKEDKAPVAQDQAVETYKNLPLQESLKVSDPESQAMTFTVVRGPKRGTVEIRDDGTFTYTPKHNKVGVDSFVYTATDPAGNVSREATVTVQILKPTDARQYTDTAGLDCQFEAEWLRNTGLFVGEQVGGSFCFYPDKTVSRGEFLTMLVKVLDIPTEDAADVQLPVTTPQWLKPYLAAAKRSGLMNHLEEANDLSAPVTGAEAAIMMQNALDLTVSSQVLEQPVSIMEDIPSYASASLTVMAENGILLHAEDPMTRSEVAQVLYRVSHLAPDAPGMAVFRMQQ